MSEPLVIRPRDGSPHLLDVALMVANAIGVAVYLLLASRGWRDPAEHGLIPVAGEPFVWALALPVFGVFVLADVGWAVFLLSNRAFKRTLWLLGAAMMWLLALIVDFSHH